ncbi:MAG: biotin--[acetyl-CoA-carboxylase] ligase [Phycisphaerales bacterium]|nr:MAG: biotin--[acetyl-CoA-carboxylase] ligase [Phycisphaerales bacterium]
MPPTDQLDPDKIKANLNTRRIGRQVVVYSSTSSTNDVASEYARNTDNDGLVIFAEEQTAGRGRGGNIWHSYRGESILCSVVLTRNRLDAELLSLACAVSVATGLGKVGADQASIKWPNDILLNGKKVAGILVESKSGDRAGVCVVGIGVNCHQTRDCFGAELRPKATSIDIESRTVCDRTTVARRLLTSLEHWLEVAEKDSRAVTDQWSALSVQLGHRVRLNCDRQEFAGNCIGVDPQEGLVLQLDAGGVRMFPAAHTTIIK